LNRQHSDPKAPWNPRSPVDITPTEFEDQVHQWIISSLHIAKSEVEHEATVHGGGGEYSIDILIRLMILGGANLNLYIECKHQIRPVERDEVIILEGKLRDTAAHKGMLFSTSGFQRGAIEYAAKHGIATISVIAGEWLYETKAIEPTPSPPPWASIPRFAGERLSPTKRGLSTHTILSDNLDAINEFLTGDESGGA